MTDYAYSKVDKEHFYKLFDQLIYGLSFAGGDGDVALFLRWHDYKEVVELFRDYEIKYTDGSIHKMVKIYSVREVPEKDRVVFEIMNESITIGKYNEDMFHPKNYSEMVVIH